MIVPQNQLEQKTRTLDRSQACDRRRQPADRIRAFLKLPHESHKARWARCARHCVRLNHGPGRASPAFLSLPTGDDLSPRPSAFPCFVVTMIAVLSTLPRGALTPRPEGSWGLHCMPSATVGVRWQAYFSRRADFQSSGALARRESCSGRSEPSSHGPCLRDLGSGNAGRITGSSMDRGRVELCAPSHFSGTERMFGTVSLDNCWQSLTLSARREATDLATFRRAPSAWVGGLCDPSAMWEFSPAGHLEWRQIAVDARFSIRIVGVVIAFGLPLLAALLLRGKAAVWNLCLLGSGSSPWGLFDKPGIFPEGPAIYGRPGAAGCNRYGALGSTRAASRAN